MSGVRLIVGLGNPGTKYEKTRHNIGFMVAVAFAEKKGWKFKRSVRLEGYVASGIESGTNVVLLLPMTYMNLSGQSVRKGADYYKVALSEIIVVVDDIYTDFGKVRFRSTGSPGGHNGLKSVQSSLQTQDYRRLKMGIGPYRETEIPGSLEAFVLSRFDEEEEKRLPEFIERGTEILESWWTQGEEAAVKRASELSA